MVTAYAVYKAISNRAKTNTSTTNNSYSGGSGRSYSSGGSSSSQNNKWLEIFNILMGKNDSIIKQFKSRVENYIKNNPIQDRTMKAKKVYDEYGVEYIERYVYNSGNWIFIESYMTGGTLDSPSTTNEYFRIIDGTQYRIVCDKDGNQISKERADFQPDSHVKKIVANTGSFWTQGNLRGIAQAFENLKNGLLILGTADAETKLRQNAYDPLLSYLKVNAVTKEELPSVIDSLWAGTKAEVSKERVKAWFIDFAKNNSIGKWFEEHASADNKIDGKNTVKQREFAEVTTTTALGTALNMGPFGYGISTFINTLGKNTQSAWVNGKSKDEGLAIGTSTALLNGSLVTVATGTFSTLANKILSALSSKTASSQINNALANFRSE